MPEPLKDVAQARQALENIKEYLRRKRGISGLPLAYVTRYSANVPDPDPGLGQPSHTEEMILQGNHNLVAFATDNQSVWSVIRHVSHNGPAWGWVSNYARSQNGCGAYTALSLHFLGDAFTARVRTHADQTMETVYYDGKARTFTFERYAETLQRAFNDMEDTGKPVSEARKVRALLRGLRDENAVLQSMQ
ncbi:hypothetical protein ACA910_007474 [Epithemia clementina (nom. ined.)]